MFVPAGAIDLANIWDVKIRIRKCQGIPKMDYLGHADPYLILGIATPDGQTLTYKTAVVYNTGNPVWNEEVCLRNVPLGSTCKFEVFDKDHLKEDDHVGSVNLTLDSETIMDAATASSHVPGKFLQLSKPLLAARGLHSFAGCLVLELFCRASCQPTGPLIHYGPVRYRISDSRLAGALTGHSSDDGLLAYAAYKLNLTGLSAFFPAAASIPWNTSYSKARQLYGNAAIMQAVRAQHSLLYKDKGHKKSRGTLRGGGDLVKLLGGGVRAQQRRYYTYVLMGDGTLRFSETGAPFFADMMSKHAMHAGCAEKVVYAGEFCMLPKKLPAGPASDEADSANGATSSSPASSSSSTSTAVTALSLAEAEEDAQVSKEALKGVGGSNAGDWTLVIDNNSGTFAPPAAQLPMLVALLEHNFPGLRVQALAQGDTRLAELRARIPSRQAV